MVIFVANVPRLFVAAFTGPLIPPICWNDYTTGFPESAPVRATRFFYSCVDGHRDFLLLRPRRVMAPRHRIDESLTLQPMHYIHGSTWRHVVASRQLA